MGILFNPGGTMKTSFSWGLEHETNNMAEILALFQGKILAKEGIKDAFVIGDSRKTISSFSSRRSFRNIKMDRILERIWKILETLGTGNSFTSSK